MHAVSSVCLSFFVAGRFTRQCLHFNFYVQIECQLAADDRTGRKAIIKPFCVCIVVILAVASAVLSDMGLTEIIRFSLPALTSIYPPFIVLVIAGAVLPGKIRPALVFMPSVMTALVFCIVQSLVPAGSMPALMVEVPLYKEGMSWLIPTTGVLMVMSLINVLRTQMQHVSLRGKLTEKRQTE
ncbi:TPA: branched-chain amino acid transport system II carrier protein [Klebsiella variicola subsp. variicola]